MDNGIVCIIDSLGTKGVWNVADHNHFIDRLNRIHTILRNMKTTAMNQQSLVCEIDYLTISDTIIITLKFKNKELLNEPNILIPVFARMIDGLFANCLAENLFMRGAISCGQFIKSGSILVGPAIDDAASFHEKPEMIGIILTPNTTLLADYALDWLSHYPINDYDHSQHLIKYNTPLKGGKNVNLHQINWPSSTVKAWDKSEPISASSRLKSFLGAYPIPEDAYQKHQNTISFFEYAISLNK